jgi:hypothetical protein
MKPLFLAFALFFAGAAHAEEIRWQDEGQGTHFWVLHDEGGATYIDRFYKARGSFQKLESTRVFQNDEAARNEFSKVTRGLSPSAPSWLENSSPQATDTGVIVWDTKFEWTQKWEAKFHDWVKENSTPDFLASHGIATDCADVAYSYRWIFSRIFGLPAAAQLAATGDLVSNEAGLAAWAKLPTDSQWDKDQRFLAALNYVLDNTFTHSLMRESYPVAIKEGSLAAGTYFLNLHSTNTGHTEILSDFITNPSHPEPLRIIASDVPRALRNLSAYGFRAPAGYKLEKGKAAFSSFLWPVKDKGGKRRMADPKSMPNYSEEQFASDFLLGSSNFGDAVVRRMMPDWNPDPITMLKALVAQLHVRLNDRVKIVEEGFAFCASHDCSPNSPGFENWSTPSRDKATGNLMDLMAEARQECGMGCWWSYSGMLREPAVTIEGSALSIGQTIDIWNHKSYSSDPADSIAKRWGLAH